jgi:threonine aldolase
MEYVDFRSDTVTEATPEMLKAMVSAKVGDDVYGDDPTVRELETLAASLVGKEAALYVPSGAFGNQLSLFTHCNTGNEVILGKDCHICYYEAGAPAVIAGVNMQTLPTTNGEMDINEISSKIRVENRDIHFAQTGLICLENAYSNG